MMNRPGFAWATRAILLAGMMMFSALLPGAELEDRQYVLCSLNWEPYYGDELPRKGFYTAIVQAAFDAAGIDTRVEFMPWARAMKEVAEGDRDVLMGAWYNEERAQTYLYSDPVFPNVVALVARKELGIESFDSLRELTDYEIGVGRGFANGEAFDSADYLNKIPADNQILNVRKLFAGRLDMIAMTVSRFRYIAEQEGFDTDEVVFLSPALAVKPLYIMAPHKFTYSRPLLEVFNQGLAEIRERGEIDRIFEEMGLGEFNRRMHAKGYMEGF